VSSEYSRQIASKEIAEKEWKYGQILKVCPFQCFFIFPISNANANAKAKAKANVVQFYVLTPTHGNNSVSS